jgi:hypothetical protein
MKRSDLFLRIAPWFGAVGGLGLFFAWIPWMASEPIAQVPPDVAAMMPPGCPAVFTNHGQHTCFWPGLIRDHPLKFALVSGSFLAFVGISIAAQVMARRRAGDDRDV